ncbi:MAG: DUF4394 domain-containing protein [Gemmatimonadales bacterium]|nr:DUF4394 domain-containing protein [Gemmatimonadales bacterium]
MRRFVPAVLLPLLVSCSEQTPATAPNDGGGSTSRAVQLSGSKSFGQLVYGVDVANNLVTFTTGKANQQLSSAPITGLASGETIVGIDFRPSAVAPAAPASIGKLYGVSSASKVYLIDPTTAAASNGQALVTVTGTPVALLGTAFGVGFNPVPDRLRVHSDADQNLRINVDNGVTAVDTALSYPADGTDPRIVATG